jgi:predicted transcriptional regulator
MSDIQDPVALTAEIVAAYVSNNTVAADEIGKLIRSVHEALTRPAEASAPPPAPAIAPPISIKKSVTPDHLISMEDGKPYKSLKRHLATRGLTPDAYRVKWGLPKDYPMVAASYSAQRSTLAKSLGLGRQKTLAVAPPQEEPAPAKRGRPRKAAV